MRQQLITIPLLNVLVQWIKDRLDGKANAEHEHEYLSELPLPLTKIGETDGQMTYDGQIVTGGGGGEPAWGEYGQFKKVIVDAGIYDKVPDFYDFVRDNYALQPGMYVFVTKLAPTGTILFSGDGITATKMYTDGIWLDLGGEGLPPPFAIADIPNMFAEMLEEMSVLVYDNLEMEGEPIASFGRTDLPAFRNLEIAYATIYNSYAEVGGSLHNIRVEMQIFNDAIYFLETDGRWSRYIDDRFYYHGNPYPEP